MSSETEPQSALFRIDETPDSLLYELWGNDTDSANNFADRLADELVARGHVAGGERDRIGVALKEALYNAILHGNLGVDSELKQEGFAPFEDEVERRRQRKTFQIRSLIVEARFEPDAARITITDQGEGFDPDEVPDPADADPGQLHGRGLAMIRAFVDDVTFNDAGNEITLVVRARH